MVKDQAKEDEHVYNRIREWANQQMITINLISSRFWTDFCGRKSGWCKSDKIRWKYKNKLRSINKLQQGSNLLENDDEREYIAKISISIILIITFLYF